MFDDINNIENQNKPDILEKDIDKNNAYIEKINEFNKAYNTKDSKKKSDSKVGLLVILILILLIIASLFFILPRFQDKFSWIFDKINKSETKNPVEDKPENENTEEFILDETIDEILDSTIENEIPETATQTEEVIEAIIVEEETENIELLDTDGDGLLDIYEIVYGSDPEIFDTDRDGYGDGEEVVNDYLPTGPGKLNDDKNIFYFAYGSNMNVDTMNLRCGENNFVGFKNSYLENYSFYFYGRGYGNIKPNSGERVNGVLYKINQECFTKLDKSEGYPNMYQREIVTIKNPLKDFQAEVYIVLNDKTTAIPSDSYFDTVITGAKQYGLPLDYIEYINSFKQ